ncbi:MAG: AsmA-like C-terminal region-containing protein [Bacteroidales bacterium]
MRWVKYIILLTLGLLLLTGILLGIYASVRKDKISSALIAKLNESVNTKISYGDLRVTIFESFPNITVRFNDLLVEPSPFYDKTQFGNENNDTLLYASSLSLTVSIPSLLTGTVAVRSISVRDGEVSLLTDKRGDINYQVFSGQKKDGKNVRLKNISAVNIKAVWNDRSSELRIAGSLSDATLGGEVFRTGIYLNTDVSAIIDSVDIKSMTFKTIPVRAGIRLRKSPTSLSVAKGSLDIADLKFDINGNVNYSASTLNLSVSGKKINIASLISMLPERWRAVTGRVTPSGIMDLNCTITGPYGEAGNPHIDVKYGLSGGKMSHAASGFKVNNLEFSGGITNGDLNSSETFSATVDNLVATYGSASIKGSFMINNLNRPHITLALDGDINFNDLNRIIKSGKIHDQKGVIAGTIRLSGTLPDNIRPVAALPLLKPDISLVFKDFGAAISDSGTAVSGMTGSLVINNDLVADSLSFTFREQHFIINALMRNFIPWVAGRPEVLDITGEVYVDRLVTSMFTDAGSDTASVEGRELNLFPADVRANVRLTADSLIFYGLRAAGFSSNVEYKPYVFTFRNIAARGLDGLLAGEFMLGKQKAGGYISKASLDVKGVDINKAFTAFNNFGQTFIVSENLEGNLTGTTTILSPLKDDFTIIRQALVAEAHLLITDGRLVNFAPVESLSSYLDLDELKNISFSKLENDLFISNSTVSIPRMLINSSAVNFTMYGTHDFNNDYSYHVRLLLSEVLSRKAREKNRGISAFGQVQVDGSGKATIPLKIVCIGGKTDVGYDFGQAKDNIKTDIAIEKQTLKGILNEEYGWYKADTIRARPAENKPKFTITWEEGKEPPADTTEKQEEVTESPIRIVLKKKK